MQKKTDSDVKSICLASINRHSKSVEKWIYTYLINGDQIPEKLSSYIKLIKTELPVLYFYASKKSWYILTTRRILGTYQERIYDENISEITEEYYGDFKGFNGENTHIMKLNKKNGEMIQLEFETGKASIALIYAIDYLKKDHY